MKKTEQNKKITINSREIIYKLKKSTRARHVRLSVYRDASVALTLPYHASENIAEIFMRQKAGWLLSKLEYYRQLGPALMDKDDRQNYKTSKIECLRFVKEKIKALNQYYAFNFNKITIKNQKTRWGSCSKAGNLNFNYKILFLPERLADYLIVHELCHLQVLNHSQKFWRLVEETIPDFRLLRRQLRKAF